MFTCSYSTYSPKIEKIKCFALPRHGVCVSKEAFHSDEPYVTEKDPFNPLPNSVSDCFDFEVDVVGANHMLGPAYNASHENHSKNY